MTRKTDLFWQAIGRTIVLAVVFWGLLGFAVFSNWEVNILIAAILVSGPFVSFRLALHVLEQERRGHEQGTGEAEGSS
jgi:hypothetical protein